jgi:hypothetical protein
MLKSILFFCSISLHQVNYGVDVSLIDPPNSILFEDEFLAKYPKRTISQLVNGSEDGIYVVSGVVTGVVGGEDWWYPSCSCLKIVSREPRGYYCEACVKYFLHMVPRYCFLFLSFLKVSSVFFMVYYLLHIYF